MFQNPEYLKAMPRQNSFDFKRRKRINAAIERRNSVDSSDFEKEQFDDQDSEIFSSFDGNLKTTMKGTATKMGSFSNENSNLEDTLKDSPTIKINEIYMDDYEENTGEKSK